MRPSRVRGLTAPRAVLAVIVRKPGTIASINDELIETFPRAQFNDNEAHKAVPRMVKEGLVCVRGPRAEGDAAGLRWYEATQLGIARHHGWVGEPAVLPHVLRDSLQAKLEFLEPEDLRRLREAVRAEEGACVAEYEQAHRLYLKVQGERIRASMQSADWRQKRLEMKLGDEAVLWQLMALRLKKVHEQLVEMEEELRGGRRVRGDRG